MRRGMLIDPETGDLMVDAGSLVIGQSDDQNVSMIIVASKGEFKHAPALGVGIVDFLKENSSTTPADLKRRIAVNLKADGYRANRFSISRTGEINLDYE